MPIFEYCCEDCKNRFEELHNTSVENRVTCPQCKSHRVTRVFSTFGLSSSGTTRATQPTENYGGCCGGACGCGHG